MSNIHEGRRNYKCEKCQNTFNDSGVLKRHILTIHEKSDTFQCEICGKRCPCYANLVRHMKIKHEDGYKKIFKCYICHLEMNYAKRNDHLEKFHQDIVYKCDICEKEYSCATNIKMHYRSVHYVTKVKCDQCGRDFKLKEYLHRHIKAVHEKLRDHKCNTCNKSFSQLGALKQHIRSIHEGLRQFRCDTCKKTFTQLIALQNHQNAVHGDSKQFKCNSCQSSFALKGRLRFHEKMVHNQSTINHNCKSCEKQFKSITYLKMHIINVHDHSDRKIKCELCGYELIKKKFKDHLDKIHGENKKVQCEICNKIFSCIGNLRIHLATHEKKFKCDSCEEEFSKEFFLKRHFNKTHVEKTVKCDLCDKQFPSKKNLDVHINVHNKEDNIMKITKEERLSKVMKFSKDKINENKTVSCLGCYRPWKLSSILRHLARTPNCKDKYSDTEIVSISNKCKEYRDYMVQLYGKIRYQKSQLEQEEKLYQKAEEKSMAYKKSYLPLMSQISK